MRIVLQVLSLAAAGLALVAATISFMNGSDVAVIEQAMAARGGMDLFGSDFSALLKSMTRQGQWAATAAACSAVAAVFQILVRVVELRK